MLRAHQGALAGQGTPYFLRLRNPPRVPRFIFPFQTPGNNDWHFVFCRALPCYTKSCRWLSFDPPNPDDVDDDGWEEAAELELASAINL